MPKFKYEVRLGPNSMQTGPDGFAETKEYLRGRGVALSLNWLPDGLILQFENLAPSSEPLGVLSGLSAAEKRVAEAVAKLRERLDRLEAGGHPDLPSFASPALDREIRRIAREEISTYFREVSEIRARAKE